jgi:hypothetical protein
MKETIPMSPSELFDDIIQSIDPDEVPLEFIILAKVTDFSGNDRVLKGPELAKVMRGPERRLVAEARVILDVRKIRAVVAAGVNEIYDAINQMNLDAAMGVNVTPDDDEDDKDTDI